MCVICSLFYLMYGKLLKTGGYGYGRFRGDNVAYLKQSFSMIEKMCRLEKPNSRLQKHITIK